MQDVELAITLLYQLGEGAAEETLKPGSGTLGQLATGASPQHFLHLNLLHFIFFAFGSFVSGFSASTSFASRSFVSELFASTSFASRSFASGSLASRPHAFCVCNILKPLYSEHEIS